MLIGVLIIQISGQSLDVAFRSGDILVFLGAVVSGFGAVLFKKFLSHVMPELAILIRNIAGFSAAFIAAMFFEHPFLEEVSAFPVAQVLLLLAFAFFSRYLNHTCYYEALDRLPASAVSLIQIATPLAGVLFAFLILGESVDSHQILGGIFIIIGLALEHISSPSLHLCPPDSGDSCIMRHHVLHRCFLHLQES